MNATPEKVAALVAAAEAWRGTPFCEGRPVKGSGVNCHHCVAEILFDAGWLERFPVIDGPRDWALAQERSLMVDFIESCGRFDEVWHHVNDGPACPALQPGDVLGFHLGHTIHHLALALGGRCVVHAVHGHGVAIAEAIPAVWEKRLHRIWRVK